MNSQMLVFMLVGGWPDGPPGGLLINLLLAVAALTGGLLLALPLALARMTGRRLLALPATATVELLRSTPLLLLVFWAHFSLPLLVGGYPNPLLAALAALTLHAAANLSEIIRAGFRSVPAGEVEAALATGMTPMQAMRHVVLPQGLRRMTPAGFSFAVSLFKDTAVIYVVGVVDLMQAGLVVAERRPSQMLQVYLAMALLFFLVSSLISVAGHRVERRWRLQTLPTH
jgi:polar amino acid transport system permease protein